MTKKKREFCKLVKKKVKIYQNESKSKWNRLGTHISLTSTKFSHEIEKYCFNMIVV